MLAVSIQPHSAAEALAAGMSYYWADPCPCHPGLLGARDLSHRCPGCVNATGGYGPRRKARRPYKIGKLCVRHPELEGKRFQGNRDCPECALERRRVVRAALPPPAPKGPKSDPANTYCGKVCEEHPELEGKRYKTTHGCVGCIRERATSRARRKQQAAALDKAALTKASQITVVVEAEVEADRLERARAWALEERRRQLLREGDGMPPRGARV